MEKVLLLQSLKDDLFHSWLLSMYQAFGKQPKKTSMADVLQLQHTNTHTHNLQPLGVQPSWCFRFTRSGTFLQTAQQNSTAPKHAEKETDCSCKLSNLVQVTYADFSGSHLQKFRLLEPHMGPQPRLQRQTSSKNSVISVGLPI